MAVTFIRDVQVDEASLETRPSNIEATKGLAAEVQGKFQDKDGKRIMAPPGCIDPKIAGK